MIPPPALADLTTITSWSEYATMLIKFQDPDFTCGSLCRCPNLGFVVIYAVKYYAVLFMERGHSRNYRTLGWAESTDSDGPITKLHLYIAQLFSDVKTCNHYNQNYNLKN